MLERAPFEVGQPRPLARRQPGSVRERHVDDRHEAQPPRLVFDDVRHRPERKAVDQDDIAVGNRGELWGGGVDRWRQRVGDRIDLDDPDIPSPGLQSLGHPPVIDGPAGSHRDRAGDNDRDPFHEIVFSYDAAATCDSCSVTFRLSMPAAFGPTSPSAIARATRSNTYRAMNSVVVLRPLNAGTSSRF